MMKRIALIAYYYSPYQGVGAKRATYWGENINNLDKSIRCDVITATPQLNIKNECNNIIFIKDQNKNTLLSRIIKDSGLKWYKNLKSYLSTMNSQNRYDVIIITGGPFLHFGLARYLKRKFGCKVILDFRDPFAQNPRYDNKWIIKQIKKILEYFYVKNADKVITVNKYCKELIVGNKRYSNKFEIIDNGFDENLVDKVKINNEMYNKISDVKKIVYAGTIYKEVDPIKFINVISQRIFRDKYKFVHIGKEQDGLININNIEVLGEKDYYSTLENIMKSDIGLIFTAGKEFQSTTKIFDYIAFNKPILVITEGQLHTGNINEILKGLRNIFWAKNSVEDITRVLNEIYEADIQVVKSDVIKYSRKSGLKKLLRIIHEILH